MLDQWLVIAIFIAAILCEFIDSSLGGGYGTILTPLFVSFFGINKNTIVVSILISEILTGILGPLSHHGFGNTKFDRSEEGKQNWKILGLIGGLGTIAAFFTVFIAISINKFLFGIYIGTLVTCMGLLMLRKKKFKFSWKKLAGVGTLAAFNKSLSGGGFGPLVTAGQVVSGRDLKSSIASALSTETPICIAGLLGYIWLQPAVFTIDFFAFTTALCVGAIPGAILGALATNLIGKNEIKLKYITIGLILFLGVFSLLRTILGF
ncbi:MAG: sulfite exporter TauE/SafE family protein [Candidatus Odinarchaeota archaeon]